MWYVQQYDIVIARAVADMRILAELCLPLIPKNGFFIAAKGPDPEVCSLIFSSCSTMWQ